MSSTIIAASIAGSFIRLAFDLKLDPLCGKTCFSSPTLHALAAFADTGA
jgi:hypothetical protein